MLLRNSLLMALASLSLLLAACASMKDTPEHALNAVEDNTSGLWEKARAAMGVPRRKEAVKTQARYCYHSYQDIICYDQPIPGEEDRLVAWQGSRGQTGYVLQSEPNRNQSIAPVSLPPLKAETVNPPPKIAADKNTDANKKQLKEIIFDPAELQPKELVPQKTE